MNILGSCFPRLRRPVSARTIDPLFHVSVEHLFNPLGGLLESSSNNLDDSWKTSLVELSHLTDSDDEEECSKISVASTISSIPPPPPPPRRQVWFAPEEQVKLIPSHRDLTDHEWDDLFVRWEEIDENARRNRIEWRFEGGNWMNVLEEDQHVLCSDGNRYHPITVQIHLRNLEERRKREQRLQKMMIDHKAVEQPLAAPVCLKKRKHKLEQVLQDVTNATRLGTKRQKVAAFEPSQQLRNRKMAATRHQQQKIAWAGLCFTQ